MINQPPKIIFGKNTARAFTYPNNCLVITSKGAKKRNWLNYTNLEKSYIFDQVESNPKMITSEKIISEFQSSNFSRVIGIGGGSSLDVAKYVAWKLNKKSILI